MVEGSHQIPYECIELGLGDVHTCVGCAHGLALVLAGTPCTGADLVDEVVAYLAPSIFGDSARGLFALPELRNLDERTQLKISDVRQIGIDLRITADVLKG